MGSLVDLDHWKGSRLEQPVHGGGELVAARQQQPGDRWEGGGERRGEARDEDVRAVGWHHHQRSVDEVLDEVLGAHRRDPHILHLALEHAIDGEHRPGAEGRLDLAHARVGELGVLGHHVDPLLAGVRREPELDIVHRVGRDAVDDHAEQLAVLALELLARELHLLDDVGARRRVDHHQHRSAELVGEVRVEVEVERGSGADEVGAFADDEVAASLELLVGRQDLLLDLLVGAVRDQRRDGVGAGAVHLGVVELELVALAHQLDLRIGLLAGAHDRAEEADALQARGEHLHEAERDDRLAAVRAHRGDVDVLCHWLLSRLVPSVRGCVAPWVA